MRRFSPIIKLFQNQDDFLITSHRNPDGDAAGASIALALFLEKLKKNVSIIWHDSLPSIYDFLPHKDKIISSENISSTKKFTVSIILDCNDISRIGNVRKFTERSSIVINIDHHTGSPGIGEYNYIDQNASSVAEIIFKLIKLFGDYIDYEIGLCLYVGIATDTGYFKQDNTTKDALSIASELVDIGINPGYVYSCIYENLTPGMLKLIGMVLQEARLSMNGEVIYSRISEEMYKECRIFDSEFESEFVFTHLRRVKGVSIMVLFRELGKDKTRVNLRSKKEDILKIAQKYGGGGHKLSAGVIINKNIKEVEKLILQELNVF